MRDPAVIPTRRTCPFDPPGEYARLREQDPVSRVEFQVTPNGMTGWLVTRHDDVRAVLADPRFSRRNELLAHVLAPTFPIDSYDPPAAEPGAFNKMDAPEHTRYRKMLAGYFSVRRTRELEPLIEKVAADCLDAMAATGSPADLLAEYAEPLPSRVMCEMIGVPEADRRSILHHFSVIFRLTYTVAELIDSVGVVTELFTSLVRRKLAEGGEDILGVLASSGEMSEQELVNIAWVLIGGAFDTTTNMLALGTFALLENPDQAALLRKQPELMDNAIEELLRYLTISHLGASRCAIEDVTVNGTAIEAGQTVVVSLPAANRDPAKYDAPDRLDLARSARGHVAFGYGPHQCIGQHHARIVLKVGFRALLDRFPDLRLAVPAGAIETSEDVQHYGVRALPVAWN
ncbi:cytochrome P450 [Actinocrispum wychmicini]|uniref:Cytochrome P450 n=1 Tax=Actinocrispum wychmicini TaxID=1213861 RepID=A0A4R2IIL1_9PSEU|nr:cytochrome P450 [Actinocrispum wychmicini]TCO44754.1 cytochrome P450 [Actinocrispum wychmicini]